MRLIGVFLQLTVLAWIPRLECVGGVSNVRLEVDSLEKVLLTLIGGVYSMILILSPFLKVRITFDAFQYQKRIHARKIRDVVRLIRFRACARASLTWKSQMLKHRIAVLVRFYGENLYRYRVVKEFISAWIPSDIH